MYCIAILEDSQWRLLGGSGVLFDKAIAIYTDQVRLRGINNVMLLLKRSMNTIVECNLLGTPITGDEEAYLERISDD